MHFRRLVEIIFLFRAQQFFSEWKLNGTVEMEIAGVNSNEKEKKTFRVTSKDFMSGL